uniref:C-type lectin domain-containing protein n=1 Tax=Acrobeloides nanus TaxID=290746 RepID=A0A914CLI6_9BILA
MTFYIYALLILFSQQILARDIWTPDQAWAWFNAQKPYIMGTELTVSSAANQLEMWQAETFNADLIDKEISFGSKLGFTVFRIFLHDLVYFNDPTGFKSRMNTVLNILDKYKMKALFVFFDSENPDTNPTLGQQPKPLPAKCDSVYAYTPNMTILNDPSKHEILKPYILDVVGTFANDSRVLAWDVYNEPGFGGSDNRNPAQEILLQLVFEWARSANPTQPLTSPVMFNTPAQVIQTNNSDVISLHIYTNAAGFEQAIKNAQQYQRPIIVTEFLARGSISSYFANILPLGKQYNVGMIAWGHVVGKTEWNMPWDSWNNGVSYVEYPPTVWFQDIFRQDGEPYLREEAQIVKRLNGCPLGYHSKVNNWTCYNAYDTPKSWADVQAACQSDWSYPVTINNAFENSDVKSNPTNDANANCVVLNSSDGSWSNQDCSTQRCYICSY